MRAREFVAEAKTGSITRDVGLALPGAFKIPALKNQDPYLQYRMGVALANARSGEHEDTASAFGENMTVVGYTDADDETVKLALKQMGSKYAKGAKSISTRKSEEALDVSKTSPVAKRKPNKWGV